MSYKPLNYEQINIYEGTYKPSMVKSFNNEVFKFWERSLFQRALSIIEIDGIPEEWKGNNKDFLYYCLFRYGFVPVFETAEYGLVFSPATLYGFDFFYQPTECVVANPKLPGGLTLKMGKDCEILKVTPDYRGIWDIITYYAEKLATLDSAINMSIINNKFAYVLGARNRGMAQALKKMLDKINAGEPAVILDQKIMNDTTDKDVPYQFLERSNLKQSYLTTDQLNDFQTLINNFDAEIGIPSIPNEKKERMVTAEAESRKTDSVARCTIWLETLNNSAEQVNKMFGTSIKFSLRFDQEGGAADGIMYNDTDGDL